MKYWGNLTIIQIRINLRILGWILARNLEESLNCYSWILFRLKKLTMCDRWNRALSNANRWGRQPSNCVAWRNKKHPSGELGVVGSIPIRITWIFFRNFNFNISIEHVSVVYMDDKAIQHGASIEMKDPFMMFKELTCNNMSRILEVWKMTSLIFKKVFVELVIIFFKQLFLR